LAIGLVAILVAGVCLMDVGAQRRRRKRKSTAPQITNPAIAQPSPTESPDPTTVGADNQMNPSGQKASANDDPDSMRRTIHTLASQVDKLTEKITQMEESQRSLVDLERLSRAEQRNETLRSQLRDVQAKESELQAHAEEIDYGLQPANIERSVAGYGTTHPEELREQRRRQLETEKARVATQLATLGQNRVRLEEAIAASDAEVARLHERLDAADKAAIQNAKTNARSTDESDSSRPAPTPTPSPTPYPPQ